MNPATWHPPLAAISLCRTRRVTAGRCIHRDTQVSASLDSRFAFLRAPMDDAQRKDIAKARFLALRNNIPRGWDGTAVSYYHSVLAALEEAFGMNFSPFRIGEGHMKPVLAYFSLRVRPGRRRSRSRSCSTARRILHGSNSKVLIYAFSGLNRRTVVPLRLEKSGAGRRSSQMSES